MRTIRNPDKEKWNKFVLSMKDHSFYFLYEWKEIIEQTFGHKSFYIAIENDASEITGILPLIYMRSFFWGKFLISLPFVNYGGIVAENNDIRIALLNEAIFIAKEKKIDFIELRHLKQYNLMLPQKKNKVVMLLTLPPDPDLLWKSFPSEVRNQVRKAQKNSIQVINGGLELLNGFYDVFAHNMRDLGTPVYSKVFFENIMKLFPHETRIFSLIWHDIIIASGFTIGYRGKLEIPWASSNKRFNKLCPNNLLYWHILKCGCEQGYETFDFGRSSWNSGTFKFKKQWGALPHQLYWDYWLKENSILPEINPNNDKYKFIIKMWKHLPIPITKLIGPEIVKYIP